jgi:hypothetical protein
MEVIKYEGVLWSMEKRNVINRVMELSPGESSAFWRVYESYERKRRNLTASYQVMINEYATDYSEMTDKKSHRYARRFLFYEKEFTQMHKTYYNNLRQAIGSMKANKFIQLEIHIQRALAYEMQTRLPFINEMETDVMSNGKDQ